MDYDSLYEKGYSWGAPREEQLHGASPALYSKVLAQVGAGKRVLDYGCGRGTLLELLKKAGNNQVVGVEYSSAAAKLASARGFKVFVCKDFRTPFKPGSFDAVVATEVIEHLVDTGAFLDECHRVLKPGGRLVLTTPNLASASNRLKLLFGLKPTFAEGELEGGAGHLRLFTRGMLSALLSRHSFKVEKLLGSRVIVPGTQFSLPLDGVLPQLSEHVVAVARRVQKS